MNDILRQLQTRNSAPKLTLPAPNSDELKQMFTAALRAPDHAWLQPWRFVVFEGEARQELGNIFLQALIERDAHADDAARAKALKAPLRAPLLIAVVCRLTEHPKVPRDEQIISAGCAAHAMLLAAETLGYAGVWRTGSYATDEYVQNALGLDTNEEIVAFLYFGTRDGDPKRLPSREVENYVSHWQVDGND